MEKKHWITPWKTQAGTFLIELKNGVTQEEALKIVKANRIEKEEYNVRKSRQRKRDN